ncbi:Up-regulated during septation-domain-containing protein [Aspergillus recurvatus]
MNGLDYRSSQSSYGDPRHFSDASYGAPQPPPTKVLLDGYRDALSPLNVEKSLYKPVNPTSHPRRSLPPSANDPVAMYLLTETAMGDSVNYEILSVEEVERLKKELRILFNRTNAAKRKLALELKLRDAAMSLSRLHHKEEYDFDGSGRNEPNFNKTNEELALSNRKCEELSMDIWYSERKVQEIQKRLLEHTAGVLQLTHKGLKKNPKNGIPHTPESLSSSNTVDDFDDRSLYKTSDPPDGPETFGTRAPPPDNIAHVNNIQETERKLESMSSRLRDMLLQLDPDSEFGQVPQPSSSDDSFEPSAMVDAHLRYIENGISALGSLPKTDMPNQGLDRVSEQQLVEMSTQLLSIMENPGLPRAQTLPPAPDPSDSDLTEHLTFLSVGINGLESRVEKLLEQKSILTTQIQQQRELNSKSDAERDAKIADLIEQLAHLRKEFELAEREGQQAKEDHDLTLKELENVRRELSESREMQSSRDLGDSKNEAHERVEAEIARLQNIIQEIQQEKDGYHEAHRRAEAEVARLQADIHQIQQEKDEHHDAHARAEAEIARLQTIIQAVQQEKDEHREAHGRAEAEVARLQDIIQKVEQEKDDRREAHGRAEAEVARLQDIIQKIEQEKDDRREADERAESEIVRLQDIIQKIEQEKDDRRETDEHAEAEIVRLQDVIQEIQHEKDEHHEARVRAEGEVARLQGVVGQLQESVGSRESAEQQVVQLEETMHQIRHNADIRVKEATDSRAQADAKIVQLEESMNEIRESLESQLREATEARNHAEEHSTRLQTELTELERDVVRAQTELTMVKAELDGAYGTRAQRAAEAAADPALFHELDELKARNFEMAEELAALKAGKPGSGDVHNRVETLEKELRETVDDYEAMTKASIEFEKERERFESMIDSLRDRCEQLETQLNEERISWMGANNSASSMGRDGPYETTSTMVLKNEFKKMMRDTRAENMKILKAEQEERRKVEAILRNLKREQANLSGKSNLSQTVTAS